MASPSGCWLAAIACATGCSLTLDTTSIGSSGDSTLEPGGSDTIPRPPPSECDVLGVPGAIAIDVVLGAGGDLFMAANDLALDGAGHPLYARTTGETLLLATDGRVLKTFPFGQVVTSSPDGHLYIAGSFTAPFDPGLGLLEPSGEIDTFVVELDSKGRVMAQLALGLCGDGIASLAVDVAGRIAVSGTAMGTAVLDAGGAVQFVVPGSGDVAFDSQGRLIVAGATDGGGFVTALDHGGATIWSHLLAGSGFATTVAIAPDDDIAIGGNVLETLDVLGTTVDAFVAPDIGRFSGVFAARLAPDGNPRFVRGDLFGMEVEGSAFDRDGNLVISGSELSNAVVRFDTVTELDPAGVTLWTRDVFPVQGASATHAVATDHCGNVATATTFGGPSPVLPHDEHFILLAR